MLGTGTQSDPYQITTMAEFRSMSDYTKYYKLMNNISGDDYNGGVWAVANIAFKNLNGNGKTVSNILNNGSDCMFKFATSGSVVYISIDNLKMTNIVHNASTYDVFGVVTTNYNVHLAINSSDLNIVDNGAGTTGYPKYTFNQYLATVFTQSKLTLKAVKTYMTAFYASFINSSLYIDLTITASTNDTLIGNNSIIDSSYIRGKIKGNAGITQNLSGSYVLNRVQNDSYFAIETENIQGCNPCYSVDEGTVLFYDAELSSSTTWATKARAYGLTTAQCKDKDYLNSIGFTVV